MPELEATTTLGIEYRVYNKAMWEWLLAKIKGDIKIRVAQNHVNTSIRHAGFLG